jgi:hypothetical protein
MRFHSVFLGCCAAKDMSLFQNANYMREHEFSEPAFANLRLRTFGSG